MRHLETEEEMFNSVIEHIRLGTNNGDLRAILTVFRPGSPQIRIWNGQLILYAGYRQPDGSIIGDPNNVELTEAVIEMGWQGAGSQFDVLPLVIQIEGKDPRWFEYPDNLILEVPLTHPAVGVVVPVLADVIDVVFPPLEEHLAILRVVLLTEVLFELPRRPTWPPPFHRP